MYLEWKYVGIRSGTRVEVDFYSGNRIEGSGPYQPPYPSLIHSVIISIMPVKCTVGLSLWNRLY